MRRKEAERRLSDENGVAPGLMDGGNMHTCKNPSSAQSDTRDLGGTKNQPGAAKVESTNGWS